MGMVVIESVIWLFAFMILFFILAQILKDNSIVDVAWGMGFMLVALATFFRYSSPNPRKILLTTLIILWGFRLVIYILSRKKGEDYRYKAFREKWQRHFFIKSFFYIFIFQGILLLIIAYPIMKVNGSPALPLGIFDILGVVIFSMGFFFETAADYQMARFKKDPANKGKLMTRGLWQYSRHPNYFGEATIWWGIFCFALPFPYGWTTGIGPLLITSTLLFFSGVPMLEKKYENRADFREYKKTTSVFFPLPRRSGPAKTTG
ncbi:MAG: DUF1295 domain-containing protein [Candidatus Aminicenantes bacterium]|nr:DUF1295 domain-containing protein [Candidatus Aminicenantes bacterium]